MRDAEWRRRVKDKQLDMLFALGPKRSADGWTDTWRSEVFWHGLQKHLRENKNGIFRK